MRHRKVNTRKFLEEVIINMGSLFLHQILDVQQLFEVVGLRKKLYTTSCEKDYWQIAYGVKTARF